MLQPIIISLCCSLYHFTKIILRRESGIDIARARARVHECTLHRKNATPPHIETFGVLYRTCEGWGFFFQYRFTPISIFFFSSKTVPRTQFAFFFLHVQTTYFLFPPAVDFQNATPYVSFEFFFRSLYSLPLGRWSYLENKKTPAMTNCPNLPSREKTQQIVQKAKKIRRRVIRPCECYTLVLFIAHFLLFTIILYKKYNLRTNWLPIPIQTEKYP